MTAQRRKLFFTASVVIVVGVLVVFAFFWIRQNLSDKAAAALKEEDFVHAASNLRLSAYMGDSKAQAMLGDMYALGWGVNQSDDQAISWYGRAGIEREHAKDPAAPAMYYIGHVYLEGRGVPRNDAEARKWFERSAQGGYVKAAETLAQMSAKQR